MISASGLWFYLSADPVGLAGGINLFSYVGGDPVNWIDPEGLTKIDVNIRDGRMTVDPERVPFAPYTMPISSGRGECNLKPECSDQPDTGPIPPGDYSINTRELTDPGFIGDIARNSRGDWGDWRAPIRPTPGPNTTNTYGRSGFFLHGGSISGSAGCIDFGGGTFGNEDTDRLKRDIMNDPDGIVPVIVH